MWKIGILGSDPPSKLLNTVIYFIGIQVPLAFRGGEELSVIQKRLHVIHKFSNEI
jgi:hypothetical protein